jgi:hypothetical protein
MTEYIKQILIAQFEAALAMLHQCITACPEEHWDDRITNGTFRWVAYHTLFFVDLYLSPNQDSFVERDLNLLGGDERQPVESVGLSKADTLAYLLICRQKMLETIAADSEESLRAPSGFEWYKITRGELHVVNIRHVQHHTGQLSAFLRRVVPECQDHRTLPWAGSGWRE